MKTTTLPLEKLIPYAGNPRKNDHAVEAVAAAIKRFGFRVPVLAKSDGSLIDGHLRVKAAKRLDLAEVPVVLCDDLTEADIKALRISINRMAELAEWDSDLLAAELEGLATEGFEMEDMGFDEKALGELGQFSAEEVALPELASGDRQPFQQKTFTLHDEQAEEIDAAIAKAKEMGHGQSAVNENSNGNALAFICQSFNRANA